MNKDSLDLMNDMTLIPHNDNLYTSLYFSNITILLNYCTNFRKQEMIA